MGCIIMHFKETRRNKHMYVSLSGLQDIKTNDSHDKRMYVHHIYYAYYNISIAYVGCYIT